MEGNLIRVDRNGTKYFEGVVTCGRCGGRGYIDHYYYVEAGVCFECSGSGTKFSKWVERTPEYQAKLDAKREKKEAEAREKAEAERKEIEEKQKKLLEEIARKEREIAERKAKSQYVGEIGGKIVNLSVTYEGSARYETSAFAGFGTEVKFVHNFRDGNGNKLIWNTGAFLGHWVGEDFVKYEEGAVLTISGSVKDHSEYKGEKQTKLLRVKVKEEKGA